MGPPSLPRRRRSERCSACPPSAGRSSSMTRPANSSASFDGYGRMRWKRSSFPFPPGWCTSRSPTSPAERIVLLSGAGDQQAVREPLGGVAKPTLVINLSEITVDEVALLSELSLAVIGHDGDALHVAAAAGALVLAVARRPDIPPRGDRVKTFWTDDFERFPARQVVEALSKQARIDSYA